MRTHRHLTAALVAAATAFAGSSGCGAEGGASCGVPSLDAAPAGFRLLALPAQPALAKVRLDRDLVDKYPRFPRVLDQVVATLRRPDLWGDKWQAEAPRTGKIKPTNYTFGEIAPALATYLTEGTILLFLDMEEALKSEFAGRTDSSTQVAFGPAAGSIDGKNSVYSDYYLGRTIFHELMHVWQLRNLTAIGAAMDKEFFPTTLEPWLPPALFETSEYLDPRGLGTVPSTIEGGWFDGDVPCTLRQNPRKGVDRGQLTATGTDAEGTGVGTFLKPLLIEMDFAVAGRLYGRPAFDDDGNVVEIAWNNQKVWTRGTVCKAPSAPIGGTEHHHGPGGTDFPY